MQYNSSEVYIICNFQNEESNNDYSVMFIIAIIPLMFSLQALMMAIRLAASAFPLTVVGPGAPIGGESCGVGALPLADAWKDGAEVRVFVVATDLDVSSAFFDLFLLFLFLWPLRIVCYAIS